MKLPNSAARSLGIVRREFGASSPSTPSNTSRSVWTLSDGSTWTAVNFFPPKNAAGLMEVPCDPGARRKICEIPVSGTRYPRSTWCACKYGSNGKLAELCADVSKRYDPWTTEGRAEMQLLANREGFTEFNPFDSVGQMRDAAADLKWRSLNEPPFPQSVSTDRYAAIRWPSAGQLQQCMPPCPNGAARAADGKCVCIDPTHVQPGVDGPCFPQCEYPLMRVEDGRCVMPSQEADVSGCPPGYVRAQGGMCIPVDIAFPDRRCPTGTIEMTGGECKPIGGGIVLKRCRVKGHVYIPGKGCIPESEVPCLQNFYKDPKTGKCTPLAPCGDEEPFQDVGSGVKFKLDTSTVPPKCVPRCPPDQYFSREAGYKCLPRCPEGQVFTQQSGGKCVPKKEEGNPLATLLLGAGGGFLVGGPVGAAVGAAAAVALFKK
jgi:hypothetical protein